MESKTESLGTEIRRQAVPETLGSQPLFLSSVVVNGGENVSRQFLASLLGPLIEKSDYTLGQLGQEIDLSSQNLRKAGVFGLINPSLDVDYTALAPILKYSKHHEPIATKVIFDLESSEFSTGEFSIAYNTEDNLTLDLGYVNNNLNHNAELAKIGVNYRPYKPFEHLASKMRLESCLKNPAFRLVLELSNNHESNENLNLNLNLSQNMNMNMNKNRSVACLLGISYLNQANTLSVFNGINMAQRTMQDDTFGTKRNVSSTDNNSYKSSLVSHISYNSNPGASLCEDGVRISLQNHISLNEQSQNFSKIGANFMKTTLTSDVSKSFINKYIKARIFQEVGAIITKGSGDHVHVTDKFQLGGYNSFKGVSRNGMNEQGGKQFYKLGASIHGCVPSFLRPIEDSVKSPMKLYATAMVGNVADNILTDNGVLSAGVGMRYHKHLIDLDLGYFVSQRFHTSNRNGLRDGFQLEISLGGSGRID